MKPKTIRASSIELRAGEAQGMATLLRFQFSAKAAGDDSAAIGEIGDALRVMARRDWAVRVLDAWALDKMHGSVSLIATERGAATHLNHLQLGLKRYWGDCPDTARLAAAEAVWPELPESVRQEIGERP